MYQLEQLQDIYKTQPVEEALRQTAQLFAGRVKFSSSLGQEDQVLTDIIARNSIPVKVFTIDTGRLFNEVYETLEKTRARYKINIDAAMIDKAIAQSLIVFSQKI